MFKWIRELWWRQQRSVDMSVLWPSCKEIAPDLDHAKAAFAVHAFNDSAWIDHYGHDGLVDYIEQLS